jgi:hypothetical protein
MATVSIAKIKIRRGTDYERKLIILDNGELGYVTDPTSRRLFIGDGATPGGNPAGMKLYTSRIDQLTNIPTIQVGDLLFDQSTSRLFALTGYNDNLYPDYDNREAYAQISTRVDETTLTYPGGSLLRVKECGLSAIHISNNLFDFNNGIARTDEGSSIRVNYDGRSLKINNEKQLYVDISLLDTTVLGYFNPGPGRIYINPQTRALTVGV